jgi:hypothetical protein
VREISFVSFSTAEGMNIGGVGAEPSPKHTFTEDTSNLNDEFT